MSHSNHGHPEGWQYDTKNWVSVDPAASISGMQAAADTIHRHAVSLNAINSEPVSEAHKSSGPIRSLGGTG
ncbi:MAG: hypothetical protein ACRD45_07560, partial [Bryobacteraceae bacterium]